MPKSLSRALKSRAICSNDIICDGPSGMGETMKTEKIAATPTDDAGDRPFFEKVKDLFDERTTPVLHFLERVENEQERFVTGEQRLDLFCKFVEEQVAFIYTRGATLSTGGWLPFSCSPVFNPLIPRIAKFLQRG